jgi:thiamine-phosphate pyrophosphorylase
MAAPPFALPLSDRRSSGTIPLTRFRAAGSLAYNPPVIPRLYAITDESAGLSHVEQVEAFARGGARWVQVRDKHAVGRELYEIVVAAIAIARPLGVKIVVNDRVDVALAAGADGAHVGQEDLPAEAARAILGPDRIVGVSTHTTGQAREAASLPVDYVAIGPVFATATKANPDPVVGLEGVRAARAVVPVPLVAIGGITLEHALEVIAAGADSVAVVSDLRAGSSLEARAREYLAALGG